MGHPTGDQGIGNRARVQVARPAVRADEEILVRPLRDKIVKYPRHDTDQGRVERPGQRHPLVFGPLQGAHNLMCAPVNVVSQIVVARVVHQVSLAGHRYSIR